jgi:hypothetical protein
VQEACHTGFAPAFATAPSESIWDIVNAGDLLSRFADQGDIGTWFLQQTLITSIGVRSAEFFARESWSQKVSGGFRTGPCRTEQFAANLQTLHLICKICL